MCALCVHWCSHGAITEPPPPHIPPHIPPRHRRQGSVLRVGGWHRSDRPGAAPSRPHAALSRMRPTAWADSRCAILPGDAPVPGGTSAPSPHSPTYTHPHHTHTHSPYLFLLFVVDHLGPFHETLVATDAAAVDTVAGGLRSTTRAAAVAEHGQCRPVAGRAASCGGARPVHGRGSTAATGADRLHGLASTGPSACPSGNNTILRKHVLFSNHTSPLRSLLE